MPSIGIGIIRLLDLMDLSPVVFNSVRVERERAIILYICHLQLSRVYVNSCMHVSVER
jgi:hypothetical protein